MIKQCTIGTDEEFYIEFKCGPCSKCPDCKKGQALGARTHREEEEHNQMKACVRFEDNGQMPGSYVSKLPLVDNYNIHMTDNYEMANSANKRMLKTLCKGDKDEMETIKASFEELIEMGFIINLKDMKEEERNKIEQEKKTIYRTQWPGKETARAQNAGFAGMPADHLASRCL